MIKLRTANLNDIDFIFTQETRDEFKDLILCWSREEHSSNLHCADKHYLMIENVSGETQGYAILSGLQSPNRSIELTRIIVAEPGLGYGKRALRIILKKVFEDYNAHRCWLDVFEHNQRARHVYQSVGFQEEGVLREALRQKDKYSSLVIMSILENEYFQEIFSNSILCLCRVK
ncbi:GNAT family N-acetyltransferase [Nostoc edaphicum CCNP1411]|uniref:GNAT family N-acetyltransferase n=1 Tax=Nostoc edaphicum CCNP1411 TaxID=1472755 RepID=A0A7D7QRR9_9NOSO|nr:GNAT family protein [Nostoc edaphicum]QMS88003.1 GNAT family N-acetyltransferase [Nostoc edaphicum CCNP1411]